MFQQTTDIFTGILGQNMIVSSLVVGPKANCSHKINFNLRKVTTRRNINIEHIWGFQKTYIANIYSDTRWLIPVCPQGLPKSTKKSSKYRTSHNMLRRVLIGALVKGTDWRINLIYMLVGETGESPRKHGESVHTLHRKALPQWD